MAAGTKMNAIKQNAKMKQFLGWGTAIIFPLAAKGMLGSTSIPFLPLLIYWFFCGIVLRTIIDDSFPYLKINILSAKKEFIISIIGTVIASAVYIVNSNNKSNNVSEIIIGIVVFVLVNSFLEPLVWANIYDLAGCRAKFLGSIATALAVILMYTLFWSNFINIGSISNPIIFTVIIIIFGLPVLIYEKSGDITLWSVLHIIYSGAIIWSSGFDVTKLLQI